MYEHLDRLEREVAEPARIPIYRVQSGNIRTQVLDPQRRFVSLPAYVRNADGSTGRVTRQCTGELKLKPLKAAVRALLGASPRADGVPGRVPRGRWAHMLIGFSTDEADRALDADGHVNRGDVSYAVNTYPLLEMGLSRRQCGAINEAAGFPDVPKSACVGCPHRTNRSWRIVRDSQPQEWVEAVEFDRAIRHGAPRATAAGTPLRGRMFLHRSLLPLDQAPIDRVTAAEWTARQGDLIDDLTMTEFEEQLADDSSLIGCSPYSCAAEQ